MVVGSSGCKERGADIILSSGRASAKLSSTQIVDIGGGDGDRGGRPGLIIMSSLDRIDEER